MNIRLLLSCVFFAASALAQAESPAPYPTAGGEGGKILTVTNLADSGPGSLREALATEGPRIIRFAVGGEIWIKDILQIRHPFVTVEGESAPSPGITIMGDKFRIRSHDVIVRNIRVRVGDLPSGSDAQNRDGISIDGAENGSDPGFNILVENCSVSWAVDENIQMWGLNNHDIVVRNCIIAEALRKSIHPKGGHSAGLIVGPGIGNVLIQGNLLADNSFRNPVVSGGSSAVVLNNLIYNPGFNAFHVYGRSVRDGMLVSPKELITQKNDDPRAAVNVSVIGNVVIAGKDTTKKGLGLFHERGLNRGSRIYLKDNLAVGVRSFDENSRPPGWEDSPDLSPFVKTPPVAVPAGVTVLPADEVENHVLAQAGARPADRDEVDRRIIEEVRARTGSIKDFPTDPRLYAPAPAAVVLNPAFTKNLPPKDAEAAWAMVKSESDATIEIVGISDHAGVINPNPKGGTVAIATGDQWKSGSITFKASADTTVLVRLSSRYAKTDHWVYIDDVKTSGPAGIANGDFENGGGQTPEGWQFRHGKGDGRAAYLREAGMAASGTGFVKVSHGCPVVQSISVPGGQEITVSFAARTAAQ